MLNNKTSLVILLYACGSHAVYCDLLLKSKQRESDMYLFTFFPPPSECDSGVKASVGLEDSAIMTQVLPKWKQAEMASTSKYKVALLSKKISTITTACVILVPRERGRTDRKAEQSTGIDVYK